MIATVELPMHPTLPLVQLCDGKQLHLPKGSELDDYTFPFPKGGYADVQIDSLASKTPP